MNSEGRRRHAFRARILGLSSRAARPLDRRMHQLILELVPAEDGLPIPGLMGFIGCYFRQLARVRRFRASRAGVAVTGRRTLRDTAERFSPRGRPSSS